MTCRNLLRLFQKGGPRKEEGEGREGEEEGGAEGRRELLNRPSVIIHHRLDLANS